MKCISMITAALVAAPAAVSASLEGLQMDASFQGLRVRDINAEKENCPGSTRCGCPGGQKFMAKKGGKKGAKAKKSSEQKALLQNDNVEDSDTECPGSPSCGCPGGADVMTKGEKSEKKGEKKASETKEALIQTSFETEHTGRVSMGRKLHATQYYGSINVAGKDFKVIFDSGSGHLLLPGKKCDSDACHVKGRQLYEKTVTLVKDEKTKNMTDSNSVGMAIGWTDEPTTAVEEDSDDRDMKSITFAMGEVVGEYYRDRMCLTKKHDANKTLSNCGEADLVVMTEESKDPFASAVWDGVLGLGLDLSDTPEFNVFQQVMTQKQGAKGENQNYPIFSFYLDGFNGEIAFGKADVYAKVIKDSVSKSMESLSNTNLITVPTTTPGYWQFAIEDITIGGKRTGLCSNYKGGVCQGVVDTGSSLLMGPTNLISQVTKQLNLDDKCEKANIPSIGFLVKNHNGSSKDDKKLPEVNLELEADEYLDRDAKDCYMAMMSVGDTGRGPLIVLGYPFLRSYMTLFDFEKRQLQFVNSKTGVKKSSVEEDDKASKEGIIELVGIRPS